MEQKKLVVLIMSVGPFAENGTAKWLKRLDAKYDNMIVVLPKQYEYHAETYTKEGIKVFVYDEKNYINKDFEFFGFKPRNCGGIGRQGIAEAVDTLQQDDILFLQLDDDTSSMNIRKRVLINGRIHYKSKTITRFESLEFLMNSFDSFYRTTGIKLQAATGATIITGDMLMFCNRKIYNNFLMYPDDANKYTGFRYLCSDDVIYNYTSNLLHQTPFLSTCLCNITFTQNQGDRKDGNAPIYNKDCSWKKSFSLRMFTPLLSIQYISKEANRTIFRETLQYQKIYPPIMLTDKNGEITHRLAII